MTQLCHHHHELEALRAQVLLISFGAKEWAQAWRDELQVPFPILLDPERKVYDAYGLERSFFRTWQPRLLWYYTRRLLQGELPRRTQGNPHQLGGNFVVDASGIIRLAYHSQDPTDRPSVEQILAALEALAS